MSKRRHLHPMFSLEPVVFRNSDIAGRGVFARRRFVPGNTIVAYAPKQRRVDVTDPEAALAAKTKLTLLSEKWSVIIPDTSVPGGWLCNHSCSPNAAIFSDGEGRIQCTRAITPGEEVTIFYGWVTRDEPARDPCRCGSARCRGTINFDLSDAEAAEYGTDTPAGETFRKRLAEYIEFLHSIGQEQVEETLHRTLSELRPGRRSP